MVSTEEYRKLIEQLYTDTCTIINMESKKNGHFTEQSEVTVCENQPCRISFNQQVNASDQTTTVSRSTIEPKLFISPDIEVKEGSKVIVKRGARTFTYKASGQPAYYRTHQEITLINEVKA